MDRRALLAAFLGMPLAGAKEQPPISLGGIPLVFSERLPKDVAVIYNRPRMYFMNAQGKMWEVNADGSRGQEISS